MTRYFFAVVPPEPTLGLIDAFRARWGHPHHNVEPHTTVKVPFAWPGDAEGFLAPVRAACARLEPFTARLGAPARFPDAGVLYLSLLSPGLSGLHGAVLGALDGLVPADARGHEGAGYTPHLTLAVRRFGIDEAGLDQTEQAARTELSTLPPFPVRSLRCYQRTGGEADRWVPLCDIPLGSV